MTRSTTSHGRAALLRRLLGVGFWFFLLKGLLWLALPVVVHQALAG